MAIGIVIDDQTVPRGVGQTNPMPVGTDYTVVVEYDGSGNAIYVGEALAGTAKSVTGWRIKKITYDGSNNPTDVQWADGVKTFTKIWDSRATGGYVYS